MPNRIIYNNNPENVKTQIYGSDPNQPIEVFDGALAVTGVLGVDTTTPLSVSIDSLPAIEISGAQSIEITGVASVSIVNPVIVSSLPAVEVSGLVSVTLADVLTVTAEQPIEVNVLTLPEVSIGNELTIASLPAIEISGTPTVLIDQPIEVTTGTTNLAVQLAARTVTNDIQSYTLNSTSTITTPVYYVGELRDFGYLMFSTAQDVTAIAYASPLPSGIPAISLAGPVALSPTQVVLPAGYATGGYIANVEYSHYSYVALEVSTSTDVTVYIYFQGKIYKFNFQKTFQFILWKVF